MFNIQWLAMLTANPTFMVLIGCSLITMIFIIERGIYYGQNRINSRRFLERVIPLLEQNDLKPAKQYCQMQRGPLARVILVILVHMQSSASQLGGLLASLIKQEEKQMEKYLNVLGTLGNTAPFIGLLGTVLGIIKAFQSLALAGTGGPNVVSAGIAEALVATAAGLAVAIPAVIFYNFYVSQVRQRVIDIEAVVERVLFTVKKGN
jgi:biopolymer transport protein ExbB/TolQ